MPTYRSGWKAAGAVTRPGWCPLQLGALPKCCSPSATKAWIPQNSTGNLKSIHPPYQGLLLPYLSSAYRLSTSPEFYSVIPIYTGRQNSCYEWDLMHSLTQFIESQLNLGTQTLHPYHIQAWNSSVLICKPSWNLALLLTTMLAHQL